jgi:signal transduction histidine kinase
MLFLIIGLLYALLNKLLEPLRCLVDYCNDPNTAKPLPTCSGSFEIDSLKDAILNLQENNFQLYKEKEDIFKEAAHEIKTPIAILKARLSLFKEGEMQKSEFIKSSMADISTISNKLRELIFLKAIEWDIKKAKESVKMQNQCLLMQQLFHPILEKKDIKIVSDIDDDFTLYIHKEAIARVMQAIFENIFMHTKNGSTIRTYIDSKKHELKIVNEIGQESNEILFSSHIGTKLISRLAQKLDYNYETYEKDGFFYTKIEFKAQ